ncbi:MAG: PilZ domain-containing protein [Acidimicrobiia bacterium]
MTMLERFEARDDARRAWRRVPARLPMRCQRLTRIVTDIAVEAVDVSLGGARLRCGGLITGDRVRCSLDAPGGGLGLEGLVVETRPAAGGPFVHLAWTGLSPAAASGLGALLDRHEAAAAGGGAAPVEPTPGAG